MRDRDWHIAVAMKTSSSIPRLDPQRLAAATDKARAALLAERNPQGHWTGELSSSALSTATAVTAMAFTAHQSSAPHPAAKRLISGGAKWLAENVNADGGWGDTTISHSNISTTTLCWAALGLADRDGQYASVVKGAEQWLAKAAGGIEPEKLAPAITRRYGKDKTFSVPILTMCAICGRLGTGRDAWQWVKQLPFEMAAFPQKWFAALRLPVVSYALPALIAIGHARHSRRPTWNPLTRLLRNRARAKTLEVLRGIQPASGGFLEAAPLTSFVAMSLAAAGQVGHPVTNKCLEFLVENVRKDGSWPIDTNLATWVTTLSINALANDSTFDVRTEEFTPVREWLLGQQYREVHPYTNTPPGGWAWTDLTGGVPDADDTSGALLALRHLSPSDDATLDSATMDAATAGLQWLRRLQNSDGGIPTFCKGWTNLPFDRSNPDITAHAIRANAIWPQGYMAQTRMRRVKYLLKQQREDGSWIPLWFGNQDNPAEENPVYGTAKILLALHGLPKTPMQPDTSAAERNGLNWLLAKQGTDGGWSGGDKAASTVEETALALETLSVWLPTLFEGAHPELKDKSSLAVVRGAEWLMAKVENGEWKQPAPIGFYFAKLWYHERLYPQIFTVGALSQIKQTLPSWQPE